MYTPYGIQGDAIRMQEEREKIEKELQKETDEKKRESLQERLKNIKEWTPLP